LDECDRHLARRPQLLHGIGHVYLDRQGEVDEPQVGPLPRLQRIGPNNDSDTPLEHLVILGAGNDMPLPNRNLRNANPRHADWHRNRNELCLAGNVGNVETHILTHS